MNKSRFNKLLKAARLTCSSYYCYAYKFSLSFYFYSHLDELSSSDSQLKINEFKKTDLYEEFKSKGDEFLQGLEDGLAGIPPKGMQVNEIKRGAKSLYGEAMKPLLIKFPPSWVALMPGTPKDYIREATRLRLVKEGLLKE